ncbi:M15 family metallopeptidase [Synoicihabitans lomoniglobus]|uniref:M15 family metallopeptidase n=1 Tax=Synoicihabitans lomoniglobus TaxID=2909285 RepID=A0AAE9ZRQ3_9BACT|nr:M15 family metallopeptidase [Opitutaceae bacterium LMO-M01]WED64020.1 M15 family metallopeptidase [Opitutaceae bacterium LMO-M01]
MPPVEEAKQVVSVGSDVFGREVFLSPPTARAWHRLHRAAKCEGVHPLLISGFRSFSHQVKIVTRKLRAGQSLEDILRVSAYPGHSEHHAGTALDLGSPQAEPLSEAFEHTPEFNWLTAQASEFGFTLSYPRKNERGIAFEPWHWNYTGPAT